MRKILLLFALLCSLSAQSQTIWGGLKITLYKPDTSSLVTVESFRAWMSLNLRAFSAVQASVASVSSGSGTAAGNVATITGATGGATSANSGTVTGGTGGGIVGTGGNGGAITGTPGTGTGGTGGQISLTAGDGGTGSTFGGTGGNANLQAGNGGNGSTPGSGGYAALKGGNGSASGNSSGGNVFLVGGAKTGSGSDGDIYLGVSPSFTSRGKIKVGGSTPPTAMVTIGEEGTRSGTLAMSGSTSGVVTIQPAAAAGTYTLTLPTTDGSASEVLTTDGSGVLSWSAPSGGIGTLNTLTASTQTFATGTSGTDFAISSATSTHTFNLPTASASNRGALSSADWSTFNAKQAAGNYITALTGDVTASGPGSAAATVTKINGTSLAGLATGILKNTTSTGVPSIAVAGDFPTLNQNTTGSAATLTTARAIYGNNFDGSADLTQVIASTYGGTGNGFFKVSGPASSEKTLTFPNASCNILTDNTAVTIAQGGTGQTTAANAINALLPSQTGNSGKYLTTDGSAASWGTVSGGSPSVISPSQITSDQDDYNPTGWSTATDVRIDADNGLRAITSFSATSTGDRKTLYNIGSYPIYIPGQHPDGTAANRVLTRGDYILLPGDAVDIKYDGTSSRWRLVGRLPETVRYRGVSYTNSYGSVTANDWGDWTFTSSGTNAAVNSTDASSGVPGHWLLRVGTTTTGLAYAYFPRTSTTAGYFGDSHMAAETVMSLTALSDGTDTYYYHFLIGATPTTTNTAGNPNSNTVGIRYSHGTNSGKFQGYSRDNAGAESTVDLGVTVAANTMYTLRVEIDKNKSEARFYIDGAMAGRVTGNMPNAVACSPKFWIQKTAGTSTRDARLHSMLFYTVMP